MGKKILIGIITAQMVIIIFIGYHLAQKKKVAGVATVEPINKDEIVFSPTDQYKYFYELKPNTVSKSDLPRLNATNTINEDGLNDRFNYSVDKPKDTYRIIAQGDSFTYGLYVDTKDNWTELLEDKLNQEMKCSNIKKFEVLNFGVSGYDAAYEVERFKRRGEKYNSDLVVWYMVDILRVTEEMRKMFAGYLDYVHKDRNIDATTAAQIERDLFGSTRETTINKYGEKSILDYQIKVIKGFRNYYKGPVLMLTIPNMSQYYKDLLKTAAEESKYSFYPDSRDYYYMNGFFIGDRHPNQKGHKIIAEDIFNYLKSKNLIPCKHD